MPRSPPAARHGSPRTITGLASLGSRPVHLKTLTLKGFKSFASATTLRLQPGITCVVGPNGSGKSNVLDALTWVMGESSAKSLRGGKMEDVIFAGTTGPEGRSALGRAEVSLTIDNADGALPIEFAEVTITRTMFRTGGSEYAINGQTCRLLDVQELLSDSGIGREMHVIVGQGQIDAVLHASPEERRAFIEEAAGVLKHRRRKEKALRKLDAMEANLTRVADLVTEIRRQLKPLGRQAEAARRAQVVQADLRDARLRLLADDLVQASSSLQRDEADEAALKTRQAQVEADLGEASARLQAAEQAAAAAAPTSPAVETHHRLDALAERLRGVQALAAERSRLLANEPEEQTGRRDPEELQAQADRVRAEEAALAEQVATRRAALEEVLAARAAADQAARAEDQRVSAALRAAADRREGLARLGGQVAARTSRVEAAEAERERCPVPWPTPSAGARRRRRLHRPGDAGRRGRGGRGGPGRRARGGGRRARGRGGRARAGPRRAAGRRTRPRDVDRPQGGPRDRAGPQGRHGALLAAGTAVSVSWARSRRC